tara:strand:+ start:2592 stop:3638 length:1047 start_codon:yes stop_codon:yes gene_type:complete
VRKFLLFSLAVILFLGAAFRASLEFEKPQDLTIEFLTKSLMQNAAREFPSPDALQIFMCGTGGPIGNSGRAQACIAVITPNHFYLVDVGAGSTANLQKSGLPMKRLKGIFITHFHSDHIAEIYEANLISWVGGRSKKLAVLGPEGTNTLIKSINETYSFDRRYRTKHHGEKLLPSALGLISGKEIIPGKPIIDGELVVTPYSADHSPAHPAVGYRFDYRGRSVVVSGDGNINEQTKLISHSTDILFHDALSRGLVSNLEHAARDLGLDRLSKIFFDIQDYHASTSAISMMARDIDVKFVVFYHLVPATDAYLGEREFKRNMPENFLISQDRQWYILPSQEEEIKIFGD